MIDLKRLKATLLTSGLSGQNQPLFQIINQLIDALQEFINTTTTALGPSGSSTVINNITEQVVQLINNNFGAYGNQSNNYYLIENSSTPVVDTYAEPLTNGSPTTPEVVFDSFGDIIMVTGIPTP